MACMQSVPFLGSRAVGRLGMVTTRPIASALVDRRRGNSDPTARDPWMLVNWAATMISAVSRGANRLALC